MEKGYNMKNTKTKVAAVLLASTMLFSTTAILAGCNKSAKASNGEIISEDSTWYDCKRIKLEAPFNTDDITNLEVLDEVYLDDSIYALISGEKAFDVMSAAKDPDFDFNSYIINTICKYDLDGKFIEEIPITNTTESSIIASTGLSVYGDKLKVNFVGATVNSNSTENSYALIDPKTKDIEFKSLDIEVGELALIQGTFAVGEYEANLVVDYTNGNEYTVVVTKGDETIKTINLSKDSGKSFDAIGSCYAIDDDTLVLECYGKDSVTLELSVSTGKIGVFEGGINSFYYFQPSQDGTSYAASYDGIYKLNDQLEPEMIINYSDTNINISVAQLNEVVYVDPDCNRVISSYTDYKSTFMPDTYVFIFDKAEKNPNAGKEIIDVYSLTPDVSFSQSEALINFNKTNEKYYAMLTYADGITDEDTTQNQLCDELMMDIIAGEGPDIILNGFENDQFNNKEYFIDLSEYIDGENGLNKDLYFSNIFDLAKDENGEIYQIPVTFSIAGIMAKQKDVGDHKGFTFDSYNKFVDEVTNGKSPLPFTQEDFVIEAVAYGYVDYINDGKVDFNNDEFKKLAGFAKNTVFNEEDEAGMSYILGMTSETEPSFVIVSSGEQYASNAGSKDSYSIYGIPSSEEHGPCAYINTSAAISANISDEKKDAAWDFVKTMLSEDVQKTEKYDNPLSKSAFKELAQDGVNMYNEIYDYYLKLGITEAEISMYGFIKLEDSVADDYYNAANNIDSIYRMDTSIAPILEEELPSYFAGQKSIDDIISVVNNRSQTVIDERATK